MAPNLGISPYDGKSFCFVAVHDCFMTVHTTAHRAALRPSPLSTA
jgi:hypothetical protein